MTTSNPKFRQTLHNVLVVLFETSEGGITISLSPATSWRPDMFLSKSGRQFWGQIDFGSIVYPGTTSEGKLRASYPEDLSMSLKSGEEIELKFGVALLGTATIL